MAIADSGRCRADSEAERVRPTQRWSYRLWTSIQGCRSAYDFLRSRTAEKLRDEARANTDFAGASARSPGKDYRRTTHTIAPAEIADVYEAIKAEALPEDGPGFCLVHDDTNNPSCEYNRDGSVFHCKTLQAASSCFVTMTTQTSKLGATARRSSHGVGRNEVCFIALLRVTALDGHDARLR